MTIEDSNGCMSTSDPISVTVSRSDELQNAIKLYPNPTTGKVFIQSRQRIGSSVEVKIFNTVGGLVKRLEWDALELTQSIDLQGIASGIYFVELKVNGQSLTRKLSVTY